MAEPTVVDGGTGNIMIGRRDGDTLLIVEHADGQFQLKLKPEIVSKLVGGLTQSLVDTVDELGKQLAEWIGVG